MRHNPYLAGIHLLRIGKGQLLVGHAGGLVLAELDQGSAPLIEVRHVGRQLRVLRHLVGGGLLVATFSTGLWWLLHRRRRAHHLGEGPEVIGREVGPIIGGTVKWILIHACLE